LVGDLNKEHVRLVKEKEGMMGKFKEMVERVEGLYGQL